MGKKETRVQKIEQKEDEEDIRDADLAFKKYSKKKRGISLKMMKKRLGI